ncbi:NAD(P)H-hydrate dehydratase [Candidatus Desantisbacteria bacterium]|nr:NAD(P)H-hydrate dehydratase [Candidatus Desantisbacteria bacterium]
MHKFFFEKINTQIFLRGEAKKLLPERPREAHKGNFGRILIIGGSKDYVGAPVLTSEAALKTGSGLVYTAMPECVYYLMAKKFREQIPIPLPETEKGTIGIESLSIIIEKVKNLKINCIAIGPGLGFHKKTSEFVKLLIKAVNIPVIIDADAINALSEEPLILKNISAPIILTPHTGELARLLNTKIETIEKNRIKTIEDFTKLYPCVLVLKGAHSLTGYKKNIFMNITGNSGMATAGSGDVLAGMIASLTGQGRSIFDAAKLAVFLHGTSGDIAAGKKNKISITATDILNNIPGAISELINYSPSNKSSQSGDCSPLISTKDNSYSLGDLIEIPAYYNL